MILNADSEINWAAMPLTGVFETRDGAVVVVGAFKANPLRDICAALEIPDLSGDPRFATLAAQFEHKPRCTTMFRARYQHPDDGLLARPAGGAGSAVRTGARRCARRSPIRRRRTTA